MNKRIDRKGLRQPDEFHTLAGRLVAWSESNRATLLAAGGILVAVGVVAGAWNYHQANRREAAAEAFQSAHRLFEESDFTQAAAAFGEAAVSNSGTPFGHLASLYRAHALARGGDAAAAATAYDQYLSSASEGGYLRQVALLGLARAQETLGQDPAALESFSQAAALEGPLGTEALLGEARNLERTGKTAEANEIYSKLLASNPDPELSTFLRSKVPADGANVR